MVVVVGISGVTNGGKTSITLELQKLWKGKFHLHTIHQDDFYKDEAEIAVDPETDLLMWDVPEAFHMDKMRAAVKEAIIKLDHLNSDSILIIEGILLFCDSDLNKLFDRRYFLTLPLDEATRRRDLRTYEPPDVPGLFEKHVWPMYLHYKELTEKKVQDVIYMDGADDLDKNVETVRNDVVKLI